MVLEILKEKKSIVHICGATQFHLNLHTSFFSLYWWVFKKLDYASLERLKSIFQSHDAYLENLVFTLYGSSLSIQKSKISKLIRTDKIVQIF